MSSRDTATRRRTVEKARGLKHCIVTSHTARITRITHFILGTAPTHLPRRRRVDTSQIHGQTFDGCARARRTTRAGSLSSVSSKTTSSFACRSTSSNHGNTRRARSRGTCNLSLSQCHLSKTVDTARYSSGTPATASHSSVGTGIFSNVLVAIPRPIPPAASRRARVLVPPPSWSPPSRRRRVCSTSAPTAATARWLTNASLVLFFLTARARGGGANVDAFSLARAARVRAKKRADGRDANCGRARRRRPRGAGAGREGARGPRTVGLKPPMSGPTERARGRRARDGSGPVAHPPPGTTRTGERDLVNP